MQPKPASLKIYRVIEERKDEVGWQEYRVLLTTFSESKANDRESRFNDKSHMWPECHGGGRATVQWTTILTVGWS